MMLDRKSRGKKASRKTGRPESRTESAGTNNFLPAAFGTLLLAGQLSAPLLVGLDKLGLVKAPPINLLTSIANNAMDAAVAEGEISMNFATVYSQGIWNDLLQEYFRSGQTLDFLTKAGGVCAQHPAWCEGVEIVFRAYN